MSQAPSTFDPSRALAQVGDDAELLGEIAELFFEDSPRMLADIEAAIELGDAKALRYAAHALKGSVANFAADPLVGLSAQLESLGNSGRIDGARPLYTELCASVETFETELRNALAASP